MLSIEDLQKKIDSYYLYIDGRAERPTDIPDTEDAVEVVYDKLVDMLLELEDRNCSLTGE